MPAFGFDSTLGYVSPTYDQLLVYVRDLYQTATGTLVDLEQPTPTLGELRTMARALKAVYDDGAGVYGSGYVGTATGAALANLLTPYIGPPLPEVATRVILPLTGVATTVVAAGSTVRLGLALDALPWVLQAPVVIPGDGEFWYSVAGPLSAPAGSAWTITTPIAGWSNAGPNAADADPGRLAETPLQYRQRFTASAVGTRLVGAVLAVSGVTTATLFENWTDNPDIEWGATHWIELLVQGGADADVAAAIQSARCLTVQTLGGVTVSVPADGFFGGSVDIRFSRPTLIPVWASVTIVKGEAYSDDTSPAAATARENAIKDQILAWGAARKVGLDLDATQVLVQAMTTPLVPGISTGTARVGPSFPSTLQSITVAPREQLVFDLARIEVIGA